MTESTTINGFEINHPREKLTAQEFRAIVSEYGLDGQTAEERVVALKNMPADNLAYFLSDVNRRLQGSDETLVSEKTMKVGGNKTIAPEERYGLFLHLVDKIKASEAINPGRIGDALGLGVVMLHPFLDGNGRTARLMSLLFREEYDNPAEYNENFSLLTQSKEDLMKKGIDFRPVGLIPYLPEGVEGSDPIVVEQYFDALLTRDDINLYNGPAGQESLK